jgi:hypothetical protein
MIEGVITRITHSEKSTGISPWATAGKAITHTRYIGYCAVFKVRKEVAAPRTARSRRPLAGRVAARSLKTQQHAADLSQSEIRGEKSEISHRSARL